MAFDAQGDVELVGDHLDLSYRTPDGWPTTIFGPRRSSNLWVLVGDRVSGPALQISAGDPTDEDVWTPVHYHGSDQFRVLMSGAMGVGRWRLKAGDFGLQHAGMMYREGPNTHPDPMWIFLVMGDRRGTGATMPRGTAVHAESGDYELDVTDDSIDSSVEAQERMLPERFPDGSRGFPGVVCTLGDLEQHYLGGSFSDVAELRELAGGHRAAAAIWGDKSTGPVLWTVKGAPSTAVVPAAAAATETIVVVIGGTCHVGDADYEAGQIRIQAADAPSEPVVAGDGGVELVYMVADRRALPEITGDDDLAAAWRREFADAVPGLVAAV